MKQKFQGWDAVAGRLFQQAESQQQLGEDAAHLNAGQRASLREIATRIVKNGVLIADEVGMGKTRITDAAMHEQPRGFPGFKVSPAAFLIDGIQHNRLPPDWIYAHEKEQQRQQWESTRAAMAADEETLRQKYQMERSIALQAYLATPEGRSYFQTYHPTFLTFYRTVEPDRFETAARDATIGKIEREHFQFPDFGVWLLQQRQPQS